MRIFSHIKENCLKGYVVMSIMMVILVIILQITILQTLFSREKYMIQKELYETTLSVIGVEKKRIVRMELRVIPDILEELVSCL